ncbi:unnamed protein product [Tilletia controversa]|uniref:Tafazzin family protein n=3 Tax=Tilletia TaxID=13289 RepID=A0A8X7MX68_9BASI|nr:hypothetical protein CF336_g5091 [Tilletia laevis]KAE8194467.1 hypothetical protein CF328_g4737 [Tilletia controversa]KAE8258738.1 hypothetical protein A4X03_0g4294 [Tilletia caries]KAE8195201.1 hypothetical protein CF335_g5150 [Tilletia laevis]KAE8251387.1 hypothetical protein A4X06_0g2699 [Tilletia controversa]
MNLASASVITSVASLSRAFLLLGCRSVTVRGLDRFLRILHSQERRKARTGLLTYANHVSVLDEPLLWGSIPFTKTATRKLIDSAKSASGVNSSQEKAQLSRLNFRSPFVSLDPANNARWTLAASDIVYINAALRSFFNTGQVLETFRGGSPFQPALDSAIDQLDQSRWVHIFPEGYVNLSRTTDLRRFKWGISRIAMEAEHAPVCVPIWITGFDHVMPEPRAAPRWLPRPGANLSITFGRPVSPAAMRNVLTAESGCIGAVPAQAQAEGADKADLSGGLRSARERAYWEDAWQPDVDVLDDAEAWELEAGYASSASHDVRDMAAEVSRRTGSSPLPPSKDHFPPIPAHAPPPGGWPQNARESRAARAAVLDQSNPERKQIRSDFAALLRDELGRLGLSVRRAMGDGEGEGRLAHSIMETKSD